MLLTNGISFYHGRSNAGTDREVWVGSERALSVQPRRRIQRFSRVPIPEDEVPRRDEVRDGRREIQEEVNAYPRNVDTEADMTKGLKKFNKRMRKVIERQG